MRSLLMQAAENIANLVSQENWQLEFIESHGSITQMVYDSLFMRLLSVLNVYKSFNHSLLYLKRK
jgi:hypothetical protein